MASWTGRECRSAVACSCRDTRARMATFIGSSPRVPTYDAGLGSATRSTPGRVVILPADRAGVAERSSDDRLPREDVDNLGPVVSRPQVRLPASGTEGIEPFRLRLR